MSVGKIAKKALRVAGYVAGTIVIISISAYYFLGPFLIQRTPRDNEYSAQEVAAEDGWVSCSSYRDWYVTTTQGPCSDFAPPSKIAIGEHFRARGIDHEIRIILATHVTEDFDAFKKGDWYCEVAENQSDLDHQGKQWSRTWLLVPKCRPIR
jgi:hypothetical protein